MQFAIQAVLVSPKFLFRVELDEIEAVLHTHPDVDEAASYTVGAGADLTVAASVLPRSGAAVTVKSLRRFLAEQLPRHALPRFLELVSALPRTPSNKIDRQVLSRRHQTPPVGS